MSASGEHAIAYRRSSSGSQRRLRQLSLAAVGFVLLYAGATMAGAPAGVLTHVFVVPMAFVLIVGWWTAARAPADVRLVWLLLAIASTLWAAGSAGWELQFALAGGRPLRPPTIWDPIFAVALGLAASAVAIAIHRSVAVRHAAIDAAVVVAAAVVVGVAYADGAPFGGLNVRAAIAFDRPVFGLVTLVMIATAALGTSDGIRRSTVLLGASQVFLILGHLLYGYQALRHATPDYNWCDVAWATGAVVGILAGACVILGEDPLLRFGPPLSRTPHPPGSRVAVLSAVVCLAIATSGIVYAVAHGRTATLTAALAAAAVCLFGIGVRVRSAIHTADEAFARLDRAVFEYELACDRLRVQNERLEDTTSMLRRYQRLVREALTKTDAATDGELAALIAAAHGLDPASIATGLDELSGGRFASEGEIPEDATLEDFE